MENFEEKVREIIRQELSEMVAPDRFRFKRDLQLENGINIKSGTTKGTKIGTDTDQLIGFYGTTPVDQPATVAYPSGGATVDTSAREKIEELISRLKELGLIANS